VSIEGYVDPREPFGDHTGYYTLLEPYLVASSSGARLVSRRGGTLCFEGK